MGLQLIFVVETDSKCKSDWIYIKDTLEWFYDFDRAHTKLSPVFMAGKNKYLKKEKEIKDLIRQYSYAGEDNHSIVFYCFDCDDYDTDPTAMAFLNEVQAYCSRSDAKFIWFCKDIERVYIGEKVDKKQKGHKAASFSKSHSIRRVDSKKLSWQNIRVNSSNILDTVDRYITEHKNRSKGS